MEAAAFLGSTTASAKASGCVSAGQLARRPSVPSLPFLRLTKKAQVSPGLTSSTRRPRKCNAWRMQVADPLDSFRDSFGNDCAVEIRAREELEMTDRYKTLSAQVQMARGDLADLVALEKYEEACEVRDALAKLQLQKRLLEISSKPRVLYRIGDLVIHKRYGYRGVIYGHDPKCCAPKDWQNAMKVDLLAEGPEQPFYHVLVDMRDRPGGMSTYVAQDNLTVQHDPRPVQHPWLQKFFLGFEEDTYIPGQRLRQVYPNDW